MPRKRLYLDINVVEAARERLEHVYTCFDTVSVQFSGGRDSMACVYLCKEVCEKLDLLPVNVIYRDKEIISPSSLKVVERLAGYDWVDMEWYCLSHHMVLWVLGHWYRKVVWDPVRPEGSFREMPPWAIKNEHFGFGPLEVLPANEDYYPMQGKKGSVAFVTGVRATESVIRYRSLTQKLSENYISRPFGRDYQMPLRMVKPIFDWQTEDVIKYLVEICDEDYAEVYDWSYIAGVNQRVAEPLLPVAMKNIDGVLKTEPEFYDSIVSLWPEIDHHRREIPYFDLDEWRDQYVVPENDPKKWDMVRKLITDTYHDELMVVLAKAYAGKFREKNKKDPKSYPFSNLIKVISSTNFWNTDPTPIGVKEKRSNKKKRVEGFS